MNWEFRIESISTGCWQWTGTLRRADGYAILGSRMAHRVVYEALVGAIPARHDLDHTCRNRACVNPLHMEPVTHAENVARTVHWSSLKTHCPAGHPYDEANTYHWKGKRLCRACRRVSLANHIAANREEWNRKRRVRRIRVVG